MGNAITELVKQGAQSFGVQIRRRTLSSSHELRLARLLELRHIDVVLDVGANVGQFSQWLIESGYRGKIYSFEPLSDAYKQLLNLAGKSSSWTVMPRMALGSYDGEIEINIAGNSFSSSVLPMLDSHVNVAPESAYIGSEKVPIARLDSVTTEEMLSGNIFLKIDAQGYESIILEGATNILPKIDALMLEMSLVPLYDGQTLMRDLWEQLERNGFQLWSLDLGICDPNTGQLLQVDATFVRTHSQQSSAPSCACSSAALPG